VQERGNETRKMPIASVQGLHQTTFNTRSKEKKEEQEEGGEDT